jgi:hypothetical protein
VPLLSRACLGKSIVFPHRNPCALFLLVQGTRGRGSSLGALWPAVKSRRFTPARASTLTSATPGSGARTTTSCPSTSTPQWMLPLLGSHLASTAHRSGIRLTTRLRQMRASSPFHIRVSARSNASARQVRQHDQTYDGVLLWNNIEMEVSIEQLR